MKLITMYECPHCKKIFRTPDRHNCRRDPAKTNCYTCKHWGHEFYFDKSYDDSGNMTCDPKDACMKHETSYVDCAFEEMHGNGWYLNCPDYEPKETV